MSQNSKKNEGTSIGNTPLASGGRLSSSGLEWSGTIASMLLVGVMDIHACIGIQNVT